MATTEKDILMKNKKGSNTEILYPITRAGNVICGDGKSLEIKLASSINSEDGVNDMRYYNGQLQIKNESGEWIDIANGGFDINGVEVLRPYDLSDISISAGDSKVTIKWGDPDDKVADGVTVSRWQKTLLVMKTGNYPINAKDGTLVVDNQIRNQYKTTGYTITGLNNGTTYYFRFFIYSTDNAVNSNEVNKISAKPKAVTATVYGVQRQMSIYTTSWTRIESGENLTANATKDGSSVTNDFDSIYPWSDIITVDLAADGTVNSRMGDADFSLKNPKGYIMTYVPEFWYKRVQDNGYEKIYIANDEYEDFIKSEAFYIGRYTAGGSSSAITTKSGVANLTNISIADFRTATRNIGVNWGQLDILRWSLIQLLYLVEYADYDSQSKLGYGKCVTSANLNTGQCDSLKMKSGCLNNDYNHAVIYRGIENPFGNIAQWLDGVNIKGINIWICTDPSNYASDKFESPYVYLGYTLSSSSGYIAKAGYDSEYPLIQLPIQNNGSGATLIPDYIFHTNGNSPLEVGYISTNDSYGYNGLWCTYMTSAVSSYTGGRLLYIPE